MNAEQLQAIMYVVVGVVAAVVCIVQTILQRRKRKSAPPPKEESRKRIDPRLCLYIKKNGEQCQHEPKRGSRYCALHARRELMRRIESAPHQRVYEIDANTYDTVCSEKKDNFIVKH